MTRSVSPGPASSRLPLLVLSTLLAGCGQGTSSASSRPATGNIRSAAPASRAAATQPALVDSEGMSALRKWTKECYQQGLAHDPVFAKGGNLLVRWGADKRGDLLFMDFVVDSFRGFAINAEGDTLADCVVRRAREARLRWSAAGSAPLRLEPSP